VLGLGALFGGLLGLFIPSRLEDPDLLLWGQLSVLFWGLSAVPWLVFSLQYTGRASRMRLRTVGLLYVPFGIVPVIFLINLVEPEGTVALISIISSLVIIYCLGIVLLGSFLVVQASRSYVHLSVRNGVALAATPVITFMAINSVSILQQASELAAAGPGRVRPCDAGVRRRVASGGVPRLDAGGRNHRRTGHRPGDRRPRVRRGRGRLHRQM
jgi:hypothetical protein